MKRVLSMVFWLAAAVGAQSPVGLFTYQGGNFAPSTNGLAFGALGYVPRPVYAYCETAVNAPWTPCTSGGGSGLASGLVEEWPSNEGVGTYLRTLSASGNQMAATNVTWAATPGFPGYVAQYNGSAYAVGANQTNTNFSGASAFSVCAWVQLAGTGVAETFVGTLNASSENYTGWELGKNTANNALVFYLISNLGTPNYLEVETGVGTLSSGAPQLVCSTYDGSKNIAGALLYINGAVQTTTSRGNSLTGSAANSNPVKFGERIDGLVPLNGAMGYVRIYNRVLSANEVSAMYTAGPQ